MELTIEKRLVVSLTDEDREMILNFSKFINRIDDEMLMENIDIVEINRTKLTSDAITIIRDNVWLML